jgi:hypothetical protein
MEGEKPMSKAHATGSQLNTAYVNTLLFRLLEILYDSKGKGAKFRTCILGKEDLLSFLEIQGETFGSGDLEKNQTICRRLLQDMNVIEDLHWQIKDEIVDIDVHGCIHYPMEKMLMEEEVPPYTCIPANLAALALEKGAGKQTEIVKMTCGEPTCQIKMLLFTDND